MSKLKYFIIAGLLRIAGWLSLAGAQRVGRFVGYLVWRLPTKSRQVTDINLSICLPELSDTERAVMSKRSLAQTGMTMLVVTHEMGFASRVADCVIFMDEGEIIEQNTPELFFSQPQFDRTKQFLSQILHQ